MSSEGSLVLDSDTPVTGMVGGGPDGKIHADEQAKQGNDMPIPTGSLGQRLGVFGGRGESLVGLDPWDGRGPEEQHFDSRVRWMMDGGLSPVRSKYSVL